MNKQTKITARKKFNQSLANKFSTKKKKKEAALEKEEVVRKKKATPKTKKAKKSNSAKTLTKSKHQNGKKKETTSLKKTIKTTVETVVEKETNRKNKDLFVKESLEKITAKKAFIKSSFLAIVLFICVLASLTAIVATKLHPVTIKNTSSPKPHHLSTINNEKVFLTVKNTLLQDALPKDIPSDKDCPIENFFNKKYQHNTYAYNKFLVILKRGKLFITNTAANKFISSVEISPYPNKEHNAITYYDISFKDNALIATGYRNSTQSLEISIFPITKNGAVTRGGVYNIPSNKCPTGINLENNQLFFYTSHDLNPNTTLKNTQLFHSWDNKLAAFSTEETTGNDIFYDNSSLLDNPKVHTFTTCKLREGILDDCHQEHLIDNPLVSNFINNNNFYFWTTQPPYENVPERVVPNSKIYSLSLDNQTLDMVQVEGLPLTKNTLSINDRTLTATIYQNNSLPPAWHTNFSPLKIADFSMDISNFGTKGLFINDPDNYTLTKYTYDDFKKDKFYNGLAYTPNTQNNTPGSLGALAKTQLIPSAETPPSSKVLLNILENATANKLINLYQKGNTIFAQAMNTKTGILSNELILSENIKTSMQLIPEIYTFNIQDNLFTSISLSNTTSGTGTLYLIKSTNDVLSIIKTIPLKKSQQTNNDHCQNDCQQNWQAINKFFPGPKSSKTIYATTGSLIKKFTSNTDASPLKLIKTVDYTRQPPKPKPITRRPKAKIPGGAKIVNGKYVCKKKKDYVGKSKKKNKGYLHLDMECCLDPDEYPNPWCTYRPGELSVTKLRYANYHGKKKVKKH